MKRFFVLIILICTFSAATYSQDSYKWELNTGANYYPKGLFLSLLHLNKLPGRHSTLTLQLIGGQVGISHNLKPNLSIGANTYFSKFYFDFKDKANVPNISGAQSFRVNFRQRNHSVYARLKTSPKRKIVAYGQLTLNILSLDRSYEYTGDAIINPSSRENLDSFFNVNQWDFSPGLLAGVEKRMGARTALYVQFGIDDVFGMINQEQFYFSFNSDSSSGSLISGGFTYDENTNDLTVSGVESKYIPYHFDLGLVFKFSKDRF